MTEEQLATKRERVIYVLGIIEGMKTVLKTHPDPHLVVRLRAYEEQLERLEKLTEVQP